MPVEDEAVREQDIQALIEDVARRNVVHAGAGQHLIVGRGARQIAPAVDLHYARSVGNARRTLSAGKHAAHVGHTETRPADVAGIRVPARHDEVGGGRARVGQTVAQAGPRWVRDDAPEVDSDCAGTRKRERGASVPPVEREVVAHQARAERGRFLNREEGGP